MKKSVLLVSNNGQGFYNFKKELIEELIKQGYKVFFAAPFYEKLKEIESIGAVYKEITIDRRGMNPIKDISFIISLFKIFKGISPDVVILHTIKPNVYGSSICKLLRIPYVNNITGLGSALQVENKLAKLIKAMYRFSLNKSCGVFFENQGNCDYFLKNKIGNREKYIVVKGAGVNTEYYNTQKYMEDINSVDEPYYKTACIMDAGNPYKGKQVRFLFIARLMREKGIQEYLDSAVAIRNKYKHIYETKTLNSADISDEYLTMKNVNDGRNSWNDELVFQLLGYYDEDCYKEQVKNLVEQGVVEYLGVSNDTRREMSQADCIVLPSYHEGMSNVLLEGASFGLPLITTDVHGCKEAVDEGINGFLCESKSAESLTETIERFLELSEEERAEMGVAGRKKMIREFDRKLVIEKYMECIETILSH